MSRLLLECAMDDTIIHSIMVIDLGCKVAQYLGKLINEIEYMLALRVSFF